MPEDFFFLGFCGSAEMSIVELSTVKLSAVGVSMILNYVLEDNFN